MYLNLKETINKSNALKLDLKLLTSYASPSQALPYINPDNSGVAIDLGYIQPVSQTHPTVSPQTTFTNAINKLPLPSSFKTLADMAIKDSFPTLQEDVLEAPQDKANLKTITINQSVQMPSYLSFIGGGSQLVSVFRIIGAMRAGQIVQSDEQTLQGLMITNHIDVPTILLGEMSQQLKQAGYAVIPNSPNIMSLTVTQYGFVSASNGFSLSRIQPNYAVQGQLTCNGRMIWQNRSMLTMFSDFPSYTMTDFKNNPELLRQV